MSASVQSVSLTHSSQPNSIITQRTELAVLSQNDASIHILRDNLQLVSREYVSQESLILDDTIVDPDFIPDMSVNPLTGNRASKRALVCN